MLWVNSTDLKNWARRRDCQGNLPLLIRHLIRATVPDISNIKVLKFPAGDNVASPGYDGIVKVSEGTEYVPEGISIWEMGCNQNVRDKANKDYEKRKKSISPKDASERTYIFVSPRAWTKSDKWSEQKRKEGFWKDVRAYNATTLEEWIEQAPAVGIELAKDFGKFPREGVMALEDWWNNWSKSINPHLTSKLVLAGRSKQAESVQKILTTPSTITVQASTTQESIAFLAAVIDALPEEKREFYLSRSVVTDDFKAFQHISTTSKNLLLIPEFNEEIERLHLVTENGHTVYISLDPDSSVKNPQVTLPRLGKNEFISALEEIGLSGEDAQNYSQKTGRSLTVLRRQLTTESDQPEWAKTDSVRDIIPALLVSRWNESCADDKEIVSSVALNSYDEFSGKLYTWLHKPDSPIIKIGDLWRLVSSMDTFFLAAKFITSSDLQQFRDVTLKVLRTLDPALDLEPEKRWMARLYGKILRYSKDLRNGIVQTLILIGVFGDDARISLSTSSQTWVDNVIGELLEDAPCNLWMSLSDVLPLIAEASPNSFMDAVESSLSKNVKPIMCLFEETESITGPSSNHSSLLWALKGLAWSPDFLPRVTLILGKLAKYDPNPESRIINRPKNSLREIFLLWHPQTYAPLKERLKILDLLLDRYPEIGWNLLIDLMPKNHDISNVTSKMIWRQFPEKTEINITIAEHYKSLKEIVNRLLKHVEYDGQRWVKILENFPSLPVDERKRTVEQLFLDANKIVDGRYELWNKLREIISEHRSYPDTDWALPEEELQGLEKIYYSIEPEDTIDKFSWLFDGQPKLLEGVKIEDRYNDEHFMELRINALKKIKAEHGFEGLIKLAIKLKEPQFLGRALAQVSIDPVEEGKLYSLLEDDDESKLSFVKEYIFRKAFDDENWIKNFVEKIQNENWSDLKSVNGLIALPSRMFVWNLLTSFDKKIQELYWKKCGSGGIKAAEDKIYYVKQMVQAKRYFIALDITALYDDLMPPELIAEVLKKAATEKSEDKYKIEPWDIEKLFENLYKSKYPKGEITKLELLYLPILTSYGSEISPKLLHEELAKDPTLFAEIMSGIYKRKDGKQEDNEKNLTQEQKEQRGNLYWRLLQTWKIIPGSEKGSQIKYDKLKLWIDQARELCAQSDRIKVCDVHIGELLANAESEGDTWPPEAICKIIEEIESKDLVDGFEVGVHKKRGVFTKALDEGGKEEIALANKFEGYAKNINIAFPKTASILKSVAENYKNQAKREDQEAEKIDLDY